MGSNEYIFNCFINNHKQKTLAKLVQVSIINRISYKYKYTAELSTYYLAVYIIIRYICACINACVARVLFII